MPRRALLIVAVLAIWVAVVVVGAGGSADDSLLGVQNLEIVWAIIMGLAALFGIVVLIMINPFREFQEPDKKPSRGIGMLLFLLLLLVIWRPSLLDDFFDGQDEQEQVEDADDSALFELPDEPPAETVAQVSDLLLLLVALGTVGGLWYVMRGRGQVDDELVAASHDAALESDLVKVMEAASEQLLSDTDPRTAVMNAYALLESALAANGSRRAASETPTEHLRRSLQNLRIDPSPLVRLGELYEIARFSTLPVDEADQRDAADALHRARADLSNLT